MTPCFIIPILDEGKKGDEREGLQERGGSHHTAWSSKSSFQAGTRHPAVQSTILAGTGSLDWRRNGTTHTTATWLFHDRQVSVPEHLHGHVLEAEWWSLFGARKSSVIMSRLD